MINAADHYDSRYFEDQSKNGPQKAKYDARKFRPLLGRPETILDFGCGGGFLLAELGGSHLIGVEINPVAREAARSRGVEVHALLDEVRDASVDAAISHHALEHVEDPIGQLRKIHAKMKIGGRLIVVVPCDRASYPFKEADRDFHLFSWSANNLANAVKCAGFEVVEAREIAARLPGRWFQIFRMFGLVGVQVASRIFWWIPSVRREVRVVATKGA